MARIPQSEIERIKREVSIERLVTAYGVELKRHGKNLVGRCPWHTPDKTPSLVITPEKALWHCMGACQIGGSVFDWVMKAYNVSFRHAYEILCSNELPTAPAAGPSTMVPITRKLPSPVDFTADDQVLFLQVLTYYHETLKKAPEALAYLKRRGITSPEIIDRFRLGFANRTLGLRLPPMATKAGREIRERLQKLGILRKSGHEHFNGSLIIPVLDEQGHVREMYGRKITEGLRSGTPDHLYLPEHVGRGVFNVEALGRYSEIILCEALIDAITLLCAGIPNVTTAYGVNGFTADHLDAFQRYKTKRVLIAYDRDKAGDPAAEELAPRLMAAGIECFRVQFPRGMDVNAYALKVQPAAKSLALVIRGAVWMGKGAAPRRDDPLPVVEIEASVEGPARPIPAPAPEPAPATPAGALEPETPAIAEETVAIPPPGEPSAHPAPPPPDLRPASAPAAPTAPASVRPPVSPEPPPPSPAEPFERHGADIRFRFGERLYRVRGLERNTDVRNLEVNLMVVQGELFHQNKFNLSVADRRTAFTRQAAIELGQGEDILKKEMGRILLALEELQNEEAKAARAPVKREVQVSAAEREDALALLSDPHLLDRILADFLACAVVGEETNKLVGVLAAVSRLLARPLAVLIQSSSAAGKSSLMEAILKFIPPEHYDKYSAMTGQSLFYMGEAELKHKILAIAEEEGAERASYALKLLQSEGELTIASTGKDPATGRHVSNEYHVEGPVMIFLTTTAVEIDEELLNRCIVLTVNENREQTRAIHQIQREQETHEGYWNSRSASKIIKRHQNAQRLLRPLVVMNPYARQLTFRDDQTRMRRDHTKYLTMIKAVALLHQYQRPVRTTERDGETAECIDVTPEDIRVANRLANEVLGRTLDELPPQTRYLLERLYAWVKGECERLSMPQCEFRFQRRDVRALGWSDTRGRAHLDKLVTLEYVLVHRGTRGQTFVYELVYAGEGQNGQPFVMGLLDPDTLPDPTGYDANLAGSSGEFAAPADKFAGPSPTHRPPIAPGLPRGATPVQAGSRAGSNGDASSEAKNADPWTRAASITSYARKNGSEPR